MSATTTNLYACALTNAFSGELNWTSDSIYLALVKATYTPNLASDTLWSAISSNEASGTGYTAGGFNLSTSTVQGSIPFTGESAWLANTAYAPNQVVAANSLLWICVVGGTTGVTQPTWPTGQGQTVVDNTVTWALLGSWLAYFTSATASWNPLSVTDVRYGVIYDQTTGSLINLIDMGSAQSLTGPWGLQPDPVTGWFFFSG